MSKRKKDRWIYEYKWKKYSLEELYNMQEEPKCNTITAFRQRIYHHWIDKAIKWKKIELGKKAEDLTPDEIKRLSNIRNYSDIKHWDMVLWGYYLMQRYPDRYKKIKLASSEFRKWLVKHNYNWELALNRNIRKKDRWIKAFYKKNYKEWCINFYWFYKKVKWNFEELSHDELIEMMNKNNKKDRYILSNYSEEEIRRVSNIRKCEDKKRWDIILWWLIFHNKHKDYYWDDVIKAIRTFNGKLKRKWFDFKEALLDNIN